MFKSKRAPVPGTRKHRGGRNFFRRIGTFAEHRLNQEMDCDEPPPRAARGRRLLPDAWDDCFRTVERSWKAQRKTRWR